MESAIHCSAASCMPLCACTRIALDERTFQNLPSSTRTLLNRNVPQALSYVVRDALLTFQNARPPPPFPLALTLPNKLLATSVLIFTPLLPLPPPRRGPFCFRLLRHARAPAHRRVPPRPRVAPAPPQRRRGAAAHKVDDVGPEGAAGLQAPVRGADAHARRAAR
eukprot:2800939-Pleurochrysis_carterae.AAC.1